MQSHGLVAGSDATVMPGSHMLNVDGRSHWNGGYGSASAGPDSFCAEASTMETVGSRQSGTRDIGGTMCTRGTRVSE
jgi:hypothetical protein